jgi:hypothetical protein
VIQFISRASARSIQIVVAKDSNELICDAIGGTGPFFPNAYWLVVCGQHSRYYFHNNYNYLAVKNGKIVIIPSSVNEKPPMEGEFRVQDVLGSAQAIYLESVHTPGYLISFDEDGAIGDEIKSKTKEKFSQFEIQLVSLTNYSHFFYLFICDLKIAYGPGIQPEKDDNTIETSNEAAPPSYWAAANGSTSPTSNPQSQMAGQATSPSS